MILWSALFYYFVEAVRADYRVSRRVRHSARAVATSEGANALIVRAISGHYQGIRSLLRPMGEDKMAC